MNEEQIIRRDRMRFTKNKLSSTLVLIAILFDVFYFINIYKSDINHNVGNFYYQIRIGASIIYNLVFMLAAFLSSEGVKNYKSEYGYVLLVGNASNRVMEAAQHTRVVIYLLISAACCLAAAVVGFIRSRELAAHLASLEGKTA